MKKTPLSRIARHLGQFSDEKEEVLGYQIDSRKVAPGELFFALKGERQDGHLFLQEVKKRGGIAAVVSKGYLGPDFGLFLIKVEDVLESLQELARFSLQGKRPEIIGITGSVGKTTVKEFASTLLQQKFKVHKNIASYNTKLTLPLTLLNRGGDEEVLILEMGMSEPGDIRRLLEVVSLDLAVLTKVSLAHAENFPKGIAEIARGKAEIFSRAKKAIFFHGFYQFPDEVLGIQGEKVSYSLEDRAADYFLSKNEGKYLVDEKGLRAYQFDLPFSESHILENILAAISIARSFKMSWDEINQAVGKLSLPKMRFELFEKGGITFINDTYNANPESMRAALINLPQPKEGGKRIAVLGSMKELGPFSLESHLEMGKVAVKTVDHLLALGEEAAPLCDAFQEVKKPAEHFLDQATLAERLNSLMTPGDVVLVKGSRSMNMEHLFELLRG